MARFWEFAQLTDSLKDLSHFDKVSPNANLYIGGLGAFYKEPNPLKEAGVTHVISVLDFNVTDSRPLGEYQHLWVQVDDDSTENLLRHFTKTNQFIQAGLSNGGGVFVHCAMGISRSATIVCAYTMWKDNLSAQEALERLRSSRQRCQPNSGFWQQLIVYEAMLNAKSKSDADAVYDQWVETYRHEKSGRSKIEKANL